MAKKEPGRVARWAAEHPAAAGILLFAACLAMLGLLFYFVVFSDFSGSADFIYNRF